MQTAIYLQCCNFSNTEEGSTKSSSMWHGSWWGLCSCVWTLCFLRDLLCFTIWNGSSASDIQKPLVQSIKCTIKHTQ